MSTTLAAAVLALAGVAAVLAVSWAFYRIGKAEDREREASLRDRQEAAENGHRKPGEARERRRPMPPRRP